MKATFTILFCFFFFTAFTQTWERIIGEPSRPEAFQNFCETYDQGYFMLGIKEFYPDTKGYLVKTDINGFPLYEVTLGTGDSQRNVPQFISTTSDGGVVICGAHENWSDYGDIGIVKLNACGDLDWCKIWRTDSLTDWGKEIHQLDDGGYIMLIQQNNADSTHVFLCRMDSGGNPLWVQPYLNLSQYPVNSSWMSDILITEQNNFLLSGDCYWCDSSEWCRLKAVVIQTDTNRAEEWVSVFMSEDPDFYTAAHSAAQLNGNNYYLGALKYLITATGTDYLPMLLVVDTLGNFIRDTLPQIPNIDTYYSKDILMDPILIDNKLFVHNDMTNDPGDNIGNFSLHELDTLGGWHNSFLRIGAHSYRSKTILTSDGKLLAGSVVGTTAIQQDLILMKFNTSLQYDSIYTTPMDYDYLCPDSIVSKTIDLDCEIIVDVKDIPTKEEYYNSIKQIPITPAPNPATDEIRFMLKNTEHHQNIRIICYNMFGAQTATIPVNSGVDEAKLDVSSWTPGMYMAVVYAGNRQVGSSRFIVY